MNNQTLMSVFDYIKFKYHGKISFPTKYLNKIIGSYTVFRHVKREARYSSENCLMLVSFKFSRFSQQANQFLSLIPIPAIAGSRGFLDKVWMIDKKTGYWQGVYQWQNKFYAEKYKASFVFKIMNQRAISETVSLKFINYTNIDDYLSQHFTDN